MLGAPRGEEVVFQRDVEALMTHIEWRGQTLDRLALPGLYELTGNSDSQSKSQWNATGMPERCDYNCTD